MEGKLNLQKKKENLGEQLFLKKIIRFLTKNFFKPKKNVWMSHEDVVVKLPKNFRAIAYTKEFKIDNY